MKKFFYFCMFAPTCSICFYDSYITLSKTGIPIEFGLAIISLSIPILLILLWLEHKEIGVGLGILFWIIPFANGFEMSKEGKSLEEISFFLVSRLLCGVVFYMSVNESVSIARQEFKEHR